MLRLDEVLVFFFVLLRGFKPLGLLVLAKLLLEPLRTILTNSAENNMYRLPLTQINFLQPSLHLCPFL